MSNINPSPQPAPADDMAGLTPEERDIVLRGRALLKSLQGKPKFSAQFSERVASGSPSNVKTPKDPDADKPLI